MSESIKDKRNRILTGGEKAIDELIAVLNDSIIGNSDVGSDLSADKMKNAVAAKRLAFEDALYMLERIEQERDKIEQGPVTEVTLGASGFAEGRSKKQNGRR